MGLKKAVNKPMRKKKGEEGGPSEPAMEITPAVVNWAKSTMTETMLQRYEDSGELPRKRDITWRAAGDEIRPKPCEGDPGTPSTGFFLFPAGLSILRPYSLRPSSQLHSQH